MRFCGDSFFEAGAAGTQDPPLQSNGPTFTLQRAVRYAAILPRIERRVNYYFQEFLTEALRLDSASAGCLSESCLTTERGYLKWIEKRRLKTGPEQLAFKLAHEDRADCRGSHDESRVVPFHRFQRAVSMEVGQRVVLICTIWSTKNQMPIESGTWGEISEVGSTIKVEWRLPYFQIPLCDRFPPDEYVNYFEEELEMNSFSL